MAGKELNRRAVENLIRAGAFDSMGYKRRALLQAAPLILDSVSRAEKDNISGQMDLFGGGGEQEETLQSIPIPEVEEFTPQEKMILEKEVTGLYLSGHPMDEYREVVKGLGVAPIGAILNDFAAEDGPRRYQDNQLVTLAGVVVSARTRPTKNKSLMCYVMLEDDSGSMELIAFQKALDLGGAYLKENAVLLVRGRISVRDEKEPQLMVDTIRPLSDAASEAEEARRAKDRKLYVRLSGRDDPMLHRLELLLTMFPGTDPMVIWLEKEQKRIGARCRIHPALTQELTELLGESNVVIK